MNKQEQVHEALDTLRRLARTERAIDDTYGPKQKTKARRKLPGNRKWKNKEQQYSKLRNHILITRFNTKSKLGRLI